MCLCSLYDTCVHGNPQIPILPGRSLVRDTRVSVEEASVNVHVRTEASTSHRSYDIDATEPQRNNSYVMLYAMFRLSRPCEVGMKFVAVFISALNAPCAFRFVIQMHSRGGERTEVRIQS